MMEDTNRIWVEPITYTIDDVLKAIEMARDIADRKDVFTVEDVSGCTEVCTYGWKNKYTEEEIIQSLNK